MQKPSSILIGQGAAASKEWHCHCQKFCLKTKNSPLSGPIAAVRTERKDLKELEKSDRQPFFVSQSTNAIVNDALRKAAFHNSHNDDCCVQLTKCLITKK